MTVLLLVGGLLLLVVGAEALVRGASSLARAAGVSKLIIGLTVVAYGTSAPELSVALMSDISGQSDLAIGNVVGSNIFNVLLILGVSALITPLVASERLVKLDVPLMIAVSILTAALGADGSLGRADGLLLVAGLLAYTLTMLRQGRREQDDGPGKEADSPSQGRTGGSPRFWVANVILIVGGLGVLVLGSRWLVEGAVALAVRFGVNELVIGLTIVAAGTSLPELATSVVASARRECDIAVGNIVGSNLFNLLGVLGLAAVFAPGGIEVSASVLRFDFPVMIAVAVACMPVFFTDGVIGRWEGALFVAYYAAYAAYLVLAAVQHASLPLFSRAMAWFVIPITVVTLVVVTWRAGRSATVRR